jgi:16S rRNA (adenine1518-N6/adenine1519-N6)-dimethyltransferase
MDVSKTKHLLRKYRIVPNKLLGQSFMVNPSIFPKLIDYASLNEADVVLDAGAGLGYLTRYLASVCRGVVAIEKDPHIAAVLLEQLKGLTNVTVIKGDVLKVAVPVFNKVVSIPPYYLSSRLVPWLFNRGFKCGILILQKEFANRLLADVGSDAYGWLTVITYYSGAVELLDAVPKDMFYPQPEVDSVIVRLVPSKKPPFGVKNKLVFNRMVRWLFSQRNKKLGNALAPFIKSTFAISDEEAAKLVLALPFCEKRARELSPGDFGELANALVL